MECIFQWFERFFLWLTRFRYSKGYGVHSPFAFSLIREVIGGNGEYYAFAPLLKECAVMKGGRSNSSKKNKMLFRLSNFVHPSVILVPYDASPDGCRYMAEGCRSAVSRIYRDVATLRTAIAEAGEATLLLDIEASALAAAYVAAASAEMNVRSVMIVDGIYRNKMMRRLWRDVVNDRRCILTFDLYDTGLVFFDPKYKKQNYKVNF